MIEQDIVTYGIETMQLCRHRDTSTLSHDHVPTEVLRTRRAA